MQYFWTTWIPARMNWWYISNRAEQTNAESSRVRNVRYFWTRGYQPEITGGTLVTEQNRLMQTVAG